MTQKNVDLEAKTKTQIHALKYVNNFFCSSIVVFSVALAAGALIITSNLSKYDEFLHYYGSVATLCVVLGSVLSIIIALWGFYAIYKECLTQLFTFCAVVAVSVLTHATISIVYVSYLKNVLLSTIETLFDEQMLKYDENPAPLDFVQRTLNCCGKHNAMDWFKYSEYLPASCCPQNNSTDYCLLSDFLLMNHEGCISKLEHLPETSVQITTMLFIGLQVSEVITILTTFWFCWLIMLYYKDKLHDTAA